VAQLLERLQAADRPILSLDLPSGVDPDTGRPTGTSIRAAATMTVALPKQGCLGEAGRSHAGRLYLADIGLPRALYARLGLDVDALFAGGRILLLEEVG
jgi:NAD(P)H-hydrate epimerase